jgi:hypothetical protein
VAAIQRVSAKPAKVNSKGENGFNDLISSSLSLALPVRPGIAPQLNIKHEPGRLGERSGRLFEMRSLNPFSLFEKSAGAFADS